MGWSFAARKTFRLWPFYVTVTQSGRWTWGIRIWRFSHNFTRRTSHVDSPGPGGFTYRHGGSSRRRRR